MPIVRMRVSRAKGSITPLIEGVNALDEYSPIEFELTPDQLTELDQRVAEERPEFSDSEDITRLFGKPVSA